MTTNYVRKNPYSSKVGVGASWANITDNVGEKYFVSLIHRHLMNDVKQLTAHLENSC